MEYLDDTQGECIVNTGPVTLLMDLFAFLLEVGQEILFYVSRVYHLIFITLVHEWTTLLLIIIPNEFLFRYLLHILIIVIDGLILLNQPY